MGLFEFIYYLGYRYSRRRGLKKRKTLPNCKVISAGNLTTGGTGKTSLAISIALELEKQGRKPAILTRGYKGRLEGPAIVAPGMKERDTGDEPLLMARHFAGRIKDIPVIKCANRYEAGLYGLAALTPRPDVFILDDGFQHWGLKRNMDILLLSATDPFYGEKLIPIGSLREPASAMRRADIIVVSKCREVPADFLDEIRRYNKAAPVFPAWYEADGVVGTSGETYPLESLSGREVYAFSGIGEPGSFRDSLTEAGAVIKNFKAFRDHHRFSPNDIDRIRRHAGGLWIMTTEKDIMRLDPPGSGIYALSVRLAATDGFYSEITKRLCSTAEA